MKKLILLAVVIGLAAFAVSRLSARHADEPTPVA
jgi:hypothetical protein